MTRTVGWNVSAGKGWAAPGAAPEELEGLLTPLLLETGTLGLFILRNINYCDQCDDKGRERGRDTLKETVRDYQMHRPLESHRETSQLVIN